MPPRGALMTSGNLGEVRALGRDLQPQNTRQRAPEVCPAKPLRCLSQAISTRESESSPEPDPLPEAMCDKSYNAPELIKEDLLCFFKFSRKGDKPVDLDARMGKAELVKAMQEAVVAPPQKGNQEEEGPFRGREGGSWGEAEETGASTSGVRTEEDSKQKRAPTPPTSLSEEALDVPPVTATAGAPSSGKEPKQPPPFDPSKDSLVESPCPVAATRYICTMALDRDVRVLRKARNADVVGHFSSNLAAVCRGVGGEMVKCLTKAHQKMNASRDQFDKAMGQHAEVLVRLEELETLRSREEGAAKAQREALEAQLVVEREAHEAEKAAREMLEAELEEVKARATQEAERLKIEGKEEFLKSPEFDTLLGKKAGGYFKNGFLGYVAQWRANGYPEEEHPASFLNVQQAIAEMADEEEVQEEEEDEDEEGGDGSDATPPSSPLS
ncbi:hypothetical protein F511_37018 [Dorcoceras hygrometricum]|uniref:Uncharacterized protein n=1 Tax=Dorcoceras hygrometricum TaxID=472368 RepID=A0A2Z7BFR6_9LAMI|nr:hypothetical protein F511_37018 [Dorcoceras hygrometricum]